MENGNWVGINVYVWSERLTFLIFVEGMRGVKYTDFRFRTLFLSTVCKILLRVTAYSMNIFIMYRKEVPLTISLIYPII